MSAPPYHNRRAGWGRGTSYSTQSLFDRGVASPIPRSLSEAHSFVRDSSLPPDETMHSWSQSWLMSDPMYYKPHTLPGCSQAASKEDYFDGTWGSMDKLNLRVKSKQGMKVESFQRPKFHRSLDDLKAVKTQDVVHSRELQFLQTVKEAERCGFSLEDLHVAILHCGRENPVFWLEDNWSSMIKNVIALAAKYGEDNEENDVGVITASEAKQALHIHRGDLWDAVTECIENRQRKILELTVRGNFTQKQIADALKSNEGNVELAFADLLRATTKRHKFILSPGLSEDSEDLTAYAPGDDHSSEKGGKLDVPSDSKREKKKSDFLTKLSAIRNAQSERRKAREEKEMFRESTTQDLDETPVVLMTEVVSPQHEVDAKMDKVENVEEEQEVDLTSHLEEEEEEHTLRESVFESIVEPAEKKENIDDNIPEDYDTNWVESQGEWIEEYSDEQWDDENDGQWVTLQKKYQKMEKEFEDEAQQMAALWEKEELSDDVFEEEHKTDLMAEAEAEKMKQEQDEKFQQWVKVNIEKGLSEPDETETEDQLLTPKLLVKESSISKSAEFDADLIRSSPLQHYATKLDLSSQTEADWVQVDVNDNQTDIGFRDDSKDEYSEDKFTVPDNKVYTQSEEANSDDDWEKIELDVNEKENLEKPESPMVPHTPTEEDACKHMDRDPGVDATVIISEDTKTVSSSVPDLDDSSIHAVKEVSNKAGTSEDSIPKPPVRRKSKLNVSAIEEALRHTPSEGAQGLGVPPALPLKNKDRSPEIDAAKDIYAVPEKHKIKSTEQEQTLLPSIEKSAMPEAVPKCMDKTMIADTLAPSKPPRLNLSPTGEMETVEKRSLHVPFSKDTSPVTSLSNESDSNCFADSESDPEIKIIRQKYMHRKPAKYENDDDLFEEEEILKREPLDSPSEFSREVKLQSKSGQVFDFDPELPIPLGIRGAPVIESDEIESPKAFREGTARPFKSILFTNHAAAPHIMIS